MLALSASTPATLGSDRSLSEPLLLGYIRRDLLVADGQVNRLERDMVQFARSEGFAMGPAYVEPPGTWPAAFEALISSINQFDVAAVVLPSLLHFAVLDTSHDIKDLFERATGSRVLVLTRPRPRNSPTSRPASVVTAPRRSSAVPSPPSTALHKTDRQ